MSGNEGRKVPPLILSSEPSPAACGDPEQVCALHLNLSRRAPLGLAQAAPAPLHALPVASLGRGRGHPVEEAGLGPISPARAIKKIPLSRCHGEPAAQATPCRSHRNLNNNNSLSGDSARLEPPCGLGVTCKSSPKARVKMGDHWVSKQNPSTDTVRKQIQVMKDQWLLLKPTANGQSGALGGTRNLQEFNKTADLLEAWIREKEETPSLAAVLAESSDRIFLTRRILDLKQEQQRFRSLHQDMNSLAQKLEKQGQGNRKDTSARRKQLNKMWLRVQRTLKEQQETLQLALEAASFFQQADTLLQAMDSKRKIVCGLSIRGDLESCQDQDMRDIASQVMMLDVLLSQLSSIHPSLAASVNLRHQQVRESWVQLQEAVRGDRSALRARQPGFDGGAGDSLTCERAEESQVQSKSASEDREHAPARNVREPGSDALSGGPLRTLTRRKTEAEEAQLHSFCQAAAAVLSCLRENMRLIVRWRETENVENLEEVRREQDAVRQAIWSNQGRMEAVLREGRRLLGMGPPAHAKVERILGDLEELWEDLRKRHQESESALQESEQAQRLLEVLTEAEGGLQVLAGSLSVPVAMQSPELIRSNLQETSALDTELLSRGVTLQVLREQTARIAGAGNSVHRKLEMVEEKYRCVQDSLRRRISDLRDSLVLVEFLQNVQMEESLRPRNGTLARGCRAPQESPCLLSEVEPMSGKLDELQEAVQMLNEAVRERERALAAAREAESLLHLLPNISHRITSAQSLAELLSQDIGHIHREIADMKNKSSPHSLQELQRQQEEIEVQMAGIWRRASVQRDLCPGRAQELEARVQQSPPAREARQWQVLGEQSQLPRTAQLCPSCHLHFSVMSWTQDKEAEIFREEWGTDGLPIARRQELDPAIQGNIRQCQELPAAGWKLIGGEPFLTITIKQRLELLRSFLGWVLLYLSSSGNQREKQKVDAVLSSSVASMCEEFQDCCAERAGLQEEEDFLLPQSSDVPQRPAREPGSPLPPAQRPAQDPPGSREALTEQTRGADLSGQASTLEPSEVPVVPTPQPASGSPGEAAGPSLGISKEGPEKRQMEAEEGDQQVSARLHAKDAEREGKAPGHTLTTPQLSKEAQSRPSLPPASAGRNQASFHTLPNISFSSLERKERAETTEAQRLMGVNPKVTKYHTVTWPLKLTRKEERGAHSASGEFLDDTKPQLGTEGRPVGPALEFSPLESRRRTLSAGSSKTAQENFSCRRRSLGSVLSVDLPKELGMPGNCRDVITVPPQVPGGREGAGRDPGLQLSGSARGESGSLEKGPEKERVPRDGFGSTPESVTGAQSKSSCFEKPSLRFSDSQPKPRRSGIGEDRAATQGQYCPGKGFPDFRLSRVDILHEWDRRAAMLNTSSDSSRLNIKRPKEIILKRGAPSPAGPPDPHTSSTAAGKAGTGVSEDLEAADNPLELTSLYKAEEQCLTGISPESSPPLPLLNTELKASNPLSVFEYETDHQQEDLSKAIQPSAEPSGGRPFMVLPNLTRLKPKAVIPATLMASSDALHRGHALFQEVENELDGLWSNVERCRQRSCSDVVHPTAQREKEKGPCKARTQDYGQPIVTSASDLRDAEFTPSTSARNREGERRTSLSVDLRERRRQEEPRETSHQITFSDLPGAPCTAEEEEETNIVGNPRGAEFLLMEGTLGKKHTLQQGGKKAAGRSWSRYHAVLVRRTLCFYQDRKDSMKSPVLVTSLTLRGAVCSLELDYTKKPHVFRLHLADGSECLLQAPSAALTQEWVSKIQQNAAVSEGDLFQSFVPVPSGRSCLAAGAGGHQSVPEDSREIFRLPPPAAPLQASQGSLEDPGQLKVCYLLTSL